MLWIVLWLALFTNLSEVSGLFLLGFLFGILVKMVPSSRISGGCVVVVAVSFLLLISCGMTNGTPTDILCLKSVKNSLRDPNNYLTSWNFNNNTEGYICKFTGVECWHPDENRVLNIKLSNMGLKGQFPRGIQNCTSLTGLDLSVNKLSQTIPEDISTILQFVTTLDLSSNDFDGQIPVSLANCTYLNSLKLDQNRFTGQIPAQLNQLPRLKTFSVSNNLLTGQVPTFRPGVVTAESYANNPGLCGAPLEPCLAKSSKSNSAVIAGAAVGGVTFAALALGVVLFFYVRRVSIKKKEEDPEGNKWARSIKGAKAIKVYHVDDSLLQ